MRITIRYDDSSELILESVQAIRMISYHTVVLNTYGNSDTIHRNVFSIKCEIYGILN